MPENPQEENYEEPEAESHAGPDEETVKSWVKDALEDFLSLIPGAESPKAASPDEEADEPVTLRAIEKATRRAVEEAMAPLRAAAKPKAKPAAKPETKAKPEPEAPPANPQVSKIRKLMWGE
ncbi:MAG: hypothetical protein WCS37_11850 [Chloroflexota bacterium]